jgi:CheY-like chemotaxis protein
VLRLTQQLLQADLPGAARAQAEGIRHSIQSLVGLLDEVREGAQHRPGETLDFDLRVALEPVTAALQAMARDRGLVWTSHVDARVPSRVQGDPGRLRQALLLLGSHAVQTAALGDAGLRLERQSEDDTHVMLAFVLRHVAMPGSEPEALAVQVARHMIESLGGTLVLAAQPDDRRLATVHLTLAKQTDRPLPALPEGFTLAGTRVLVAEGHPGDRAALGAMLAQCGCEVALAENGPTALRLVHEAATRGTPYGVVVLDRDLAMLDGEELGRAIRSDHELDGTELVMVTAKGRVGDGARVRAAGFAAYLVKPFAATHMIEAITEVLHPSRTERPHGHAPLITRHSLAEARRARLRILLVDDDSVNQLVTTSALQRVGCRRGRADRGACGRARRAAALGPRAPESTRRRGRCRAHRHRAARAHDGGPSHAARRPDRRSRHGRRGARRGAAQAGALRGTG